MTVSCLHLLRTIISLCSGSSAEEDVDEVVILFNSVRKLLISDYRVCFKFTHSTFESVIQHFEVLILYTEIIMYRLASISSAALGL